MAFACERCLWNLEFASWYASTVFMSDTLIMGYGTLEPISKAVSRYRATHMLSLVRPLVINTSYSTLNYPASHQQRPHHQTAILKLFRPGVTSGQYTIAKNFWISHFTKLRAHLWALLHRSFLKGPHSNGTKWKQLIKSWRGSTQQSNMLNGYVLGAKCFL